VCKTWSWMKLLKFNSNETMDLYQSWDFISAGIILVILILVPLPPEIGYLELFDTRMIYEFEKYYVTRTSLVPHFRTDLHTRTRPVFQKGDTRPTLVSTLLWGLLESGLPHSSSSWGARTLVKPVALGRAQHIINLLKFTSDGADFDSIQQY
jgi:hypothetical protein